MEDFPEGHKHSKKSSREQQLSIEQYDTLFEAIPDAMAFVDQGYKIFQTNIQLEKLFGYTKKELIGENLDILLPERHRNRHRSMVLDFMSHPHMRPMGSGLELFGLRKDGTEFPLDTSISCIRAEGKLLAMAAIRDVSHLKKTAQEMKKL